MTDEVVLAVNHWASNAHLILDVHRLGYLRDDDRVVDVTYGRGTFWKLWRPGTLDTHDFAIDGVDFRRCPTTQRRPMPSLPTLRTSPLVDVKRRPCLSSRIAMG